MTVLHLRTECVITPQLWDLSCQNRFDHQCVGSRGIHANPVTCLGLRQFPTVGVFAFGIIRCRKPHRTARLGAASHGACVRTMHGDHRTIFQRDIGQKAFVTFE
ncbi:Uncharacterised protein [Vibrio cholerae]|nr:Uncharacterised protein [Vibrio cholerae]